jgi:hypothetical protein
MKSLKYVAIMALVAAPIIATQARSSSDNMGHKFFDLSYNGSVHGYSKHPYNGSRFPEQIKAPGHKLFVFSPHHRAWAAYEANGSRVATGIANGGNSFCDDLGQACQSPVGMHQVYMKGTSDCKSRKFPVGVGGAPMPYCMYFKGGYAIHGSPYISNNNTSHGCIRVTTSAAHWLSQNFMSVGTKVMIMSY